MECPHLRLLKMLTIVRAIGRKQTFLFDVFVLNSHSTPIILRLQGKQHSNDKELERADYKRN